MRHKRNVENFYIPERVYREGREREKGEWE